MKTVKSRNRTKILIIENNPVLSRGLGRMLAHEQKFAICGYADTAKKAISSIEHQVPDLIITDIYIQGCSGVYLIKEIKKIHPEIPVLVLSMHEKSLYAKLAITAGAAGYITAQENPETIIDAIHKILGGETYTSLNLTESLNNRPLGPVN